MRNRFAVATAVVFAVAIVITIPSDGFILPSTAVAQQQRINSPSQGTNSSSNPLSQLELGFSSNIAVYYRQ
jgi:hypothetical protein